MTLATLAQLLTPDLGPDAAKLLQRCRTKSASEDPAVWLEMLVAHGLLTPSRKAAVLAGLAMGAGATSAGEVAPLPLLTEPPTSERPSRPSLVGKTTPVPAGATAYRFGDVLGHGGMGCVYRATDQTLGREVAYKQLTEVRLATVRERFVREARITAQLEHPNIVPIHALEAAPSDGSLGYAMKLVEGKTLAQLIREAAQARQNGDARRAIHPALTETTLLEHFLKICDAIAFCHSRGVIHRDLKPANIMIGPFNEVYVMDWGVARRIGASNDTLLDAEAATPPPPGVDDAALTRVGQIVGTPRYMSPEQARGLNATLDGRSDQYALGVILFEIVTLRRAIPGETGQAALASAAEGKLVALEHLVPGKTIAPELAAIIRRATALSPDERYDSVGELADDVRRALRGEAVRARPDTPLQKVLRLIARHRQATLAVVLGAVAVASILAGVALYREARNEQSRAEAERARAAAELLLRERGARLTAYLGRVAEQGHRIDGEFEKLERALEGLRTAAVWALTGPEPPAEAAPVYLDTDFSSPARRPTDLARTAYRWPVSVEHPVAGLSPEARALLSTPDNTLAPRLRRISPLRTHMQRMFVEAGTGGAVPLAPEAARRFVAERRGPIDYAYVCLPEGVIFVYPGYDALPPGYDVRTAGFYQISDHQHGKRWGAPYIDSTTDAAGDDLVLPCTEGLWSPSGEFLGVAGVEITVTKMVDTALRLPGIPTVRQSLLRADGRKVIDTNDAGKRFPNASGKDEGLQLFDFDVPAVVEAVRKGGSGVVEIERPVDGAARKLLAAYVPLNVLGWYYVVEVDPEAVLSGP